MAKTSQTTPQKEKAPSSQSTAAEILIEPWPEECLGNDVVLRPSSIEEEASASVPKPVKDNKRKRASVPEDPKPKKRTARKPNKNAIPLALELVLRLRDKDDDEEEENDGSALATRTKKTIDVPPAAGSMVVHKAPPRTKGIPEKDLVGVPELLEIEDASHQSQQMGDMSEGPLLEYLRTEENAPSDSLGAAAIEDSPTFPAFSAGDVAGTSDASDLFHGVKQALNQAITVHREACSRSQNELRRYEAELQWVMEEKNSLKLLLGQRGEEIKYLRDELAKAQRDQTDLFEQVMILLKAYRLDTGTMANFSVSQLQQKIEMIGKLREELDVIKAESLQWKEGMDRFAVEKEAARAQLSSSETQLQRMKEKGLVQAGRIEELEARFACELAKAESDAEKAKADADALVAIYWAEVEASQIEAR
ncbi:uncharacterized protein [Nicotiana tomentosiformis]|uniref:uncharacterized protein n=1 Tax=Nicotiana tomentosiformis TaxID=4098 RepID=UPI00388C4C20